MDTHRTRQTEEHPAFEVHLGEVNTDPEDGHHQRPCIVWINGKRWQGDLELMPDPPDLAAERGRAGRGTPGNPWLRNDEES